MLSGAGQLSEVEGKGGCAQMRQRLGTGVPRRLVWVTSGDPRNELICYE